MVVLHWLFSPGVYLWIENAPIPEATASAPAAKTETAPAEAKEVEKFDDKKAAESPETASATFARPTQRTIAEETDDFSWAM